MFASLRAGKALQICGEYVMIPRSVAHQHVKGKHHEHRAAVVSFEYIASRLIQTIANISVAAVGKAVHTFWNLLHHFQINQFAGSPERPQTFFESVLVAVVSNKEWPSDLIRLGFVTNLLWMGNSVAKKFLCRRHPLAHYTERIYNDAFLQQGQTYRASSGQKRQIRHFSQTMVS